MRLDFHQNHRLLFGTVLATFLVLSFVIAVAPALWVEKHNAPLEGSEPPTAAETKGLQVYLSEGCVYCHTQQVRPLPQDVARYGRPSAPGDYARLVPTDLWRQTPSILGTERTGPDLSNVGERQPSEVWHLIHLYQPRAVAAESMMPSFPWLFEWKGHAEPGDLVVTVPEPFAPASGVIVAGPRARVLVAYLLSRRQTPLGGDARSTVGGGSQ